MSKPSLLVAVLAGTSLGVVASATREANTATWSYSTFAYEAMTTRRIASALPSPLVTSTSFAPPFSKASTLLPANVTYTTYSLAKGTRLPDDGPYGQSAYANLWANYTYTQEPPFTTTVAPTPVPTSQLVFPPALPIRPRHDAGNLTFPSDFVWGAAGSAWQIEGGLQVEGRGPAQLDFIGVNGSRLLGGNDSNVADMSYFLYKQDIAQLAAIGLPYYSFSISWSRVLPFGVADSPVNTLALDHYEDVIKTCLEYGVTPVPTLMHIDAPVGIFDDFDAFPRHFLYYAKQVMTRFAEYAPYWVTFNEPNIAIGFNFDRYDGYKAFLLAHAEVYHWYKEELKGTGKLTTKFANNLAVPLNNSSPLDVAACLRYQDFIIGIMGNPLFLGEQFPESVLSTPNITLEPLTEEQLTFINGTIDYFSFDPYAPQFGTDAPGGYEACASNSSHPLWPSCTALTTEALDGWPMGATSQGGAMIVPDYVRQQFSYIWNTLKPSAIMVTEFGLPPWKEAEKPIDVQRFDIERSIYYENFLTEILRAIHLDGVNIIGAIAWSFIDNNEFGSFEDQYGLMTVNRTSGNFERSYKRSFFDFVDFMHAHVA